MNSMNCSVCGKPLAPGEPHCAKCHATMKCEGGSCLCTCGNLVTAPEVKCDTCLGLIAPTP